jgi:hypothetical protein
MTQAYKRMQVLSICIVVTCSVLLNACSKKDDDTPPAEQGLLLQEDFDDPATSVWKPHNDNNIAVTSLQDGWYVVSYTSEDMGTYSVWAPNPIFPADHKTGSVEILMRHIAGHAYDKAGLLFWLTDNKHYVAFTIGNKDYRIYQMVGGQETNLVNWTPSAAIRGALNQDNKLKVELTDTRLLFYINDQKVIEMGRGVTVSLDKVGFQLYKASMETNNSTYKIDYLRVER